jgi:hypothetical protein
MAKADDDDVRSALQTLRELLTRSLMLPNDRVRETLDDAVRRGRMTRDDADDVLDRLVAAGRQQTDDLLSRLEPLLGPARATADAGGRARSAVRRVSRAAGLNWGDAAFPIEDYDELTAAQVNSRLGDLTEADLRAVRDHEKRNANRKSVLAVVERKLRAASS